MKIYDSVVVLGSRPRGPDTWELPSHVYHSLDRAVDLFKKKATPYVSLCGKWTINFDVLGITQPFRECDAMADYVLSKAIPAEAILKEADSKDTISNLYYLKRHILQPKDLKSLLFIAAAPRIDRVRFLCQRILGPEYKLAFEGVAYLPDEISPNESRILKMQNDFLAPMQDGEDAWLDGKFYNDPFYMAVKARIKERAALEPFIHVANPPILTIE